MPIPNSHTKKPCKPRTTAEDSNPETVPKEPSHTVKTIWIGTWPLRMARLSILEDRSGSMLPYHTRQEVFIPAMLKAVSQAGGSDLSKRIFIDYHVMSGGVFSGLCVPLAELADHLPHAESNGWTPVDDALSRIAEVGEVFAAAAYQHETTIVQSEALLFGDLKPTTSEGRVGTTGAGLERFQQYVQKHAAKVTVIAPDAEHLNGALANQLASPDRPIRYLNENPDAIVKFTCEVLTAVSRVLSGKPLSSPKTS